MKNITVFLTLLLAASNAYSYEASCNTDDGKTFQITVQNKVLTVNNKYNHYYQGKTFTGFYKYSNDKYTYYTGTFSNGGFPIEVKNKWGLDAKGECRFK
ncbi:hypothetical protein [Hydrogenovibrio kuenenii]|uniref:hypothetical protein n=1 Tax=Hydrogenovibrio kuenenii TaxID=63658 RepID=UPI0004646DB5|nr:hypothetical protein [Hydrogenovibrio kuenenii]